MAGQLKLAEFLPYRLSVLSNRISHGIACLYEERFGISLHQWRIMAVLGEKTDLSAGAVADRTAMDKVAVSRAVNRLIEAGLVDRHFAADDRRRSVLGLSEEGRDIYDQIVPIARQYEADLLKAFDGHERGVLDDLLTKLAEFQSHLDQS